MMKKRKGFLTVCDDVFISLSGKLVMNGVYTSDLGVVGQEAFLPQIVFVIILELPLTEAYPLSLVARITIPGPSMIERQFNLALPPVISERKSFSFYLPVLVQNVAVRPGQIDACVIFPDGELFVGSHIVVGTAAP